MSETIFAKIVKGEIPCYKVYETDTLLAFLDITQTTKGHTLLIPKEPVKDVFEWHADLAKDMGQAIPVIANALQKAFPDMIGLNLLSNNKAGAYQSVFHSHFHFIPRYCPEDKFTITMRTTASDYTADEMNAIANQIKAQF